MKNKKGFTLIELLAVIVILAIIMVIATMQVNKTIKKSRQDAYELTAKELIKQIKGKIALGEEYRCFNKSSDDKEDELTPYSTSLTDLFNTNYKNICNKDVYGDGDDDNTNTKSCKRDFGINTCQKLYNLSDDYRMMVYYQPCTRGVYMFLDASMSNSKLKGITKTHNEDLIEYLDENDTNVAVYSNDYKVLVTKDKIAYNTIIKEKNTCEKEEYSYQCRIKLDDTSASTKHRKLGTLIESAGALNSKVIKHDNKYYMGIEDACKFLYENN